ncbi:two-component system sensor histidine kinase DegS [Cerasibacillus quisquiliarum]|uniref:Signal transduction histidine-protein kinase/phosphatase DegS n=1 Tax=Cerasibacillus quisquiliarum TaxID=227865 RepID=A0A511UWT3_9BACI|nr:histidine kinase [Cerasibacillus quisquiliarum]MBB5145187.1 two-component system sensor histidine kinase DegS [Cerasibacillus quisquiliarum]GEN29923.1 signal transduction histidine-protein kinase/phosphatase DegS [Cerasibacillus quisquiliarum]
MVMKAIEESLDNIIDKMVGVVEESKDEIFQISEDARTEYEKLVLELNTTKEKVLHYIEAEEILTKEVQASKKRLSIVSKYFDQYSEDEIRQVYEKTHHLQTKLLMLRQEEKALRQKRDEIERRIVSLERTINRAEGLVGKVSVVLNYLNNDFQQVNEIIKEAKEKHKFGLKIIQAQEEERRKISREIHDGPAQMLANILLRSELVEKTMRERTLDDALKEIKIVRSLIRQSLHDVRRIIYDLRPMALDDLGLVPTLNKYLSTVAEFHNILIDLTDLGSNKRLDTQYEVTLFRLIQEAVQNSIKHANATWIHVKFENTEEYLTAVITDNGKGFEMDKKREDTFGIIGMKERVDMLSGKLVINSKPGKGTKVIVRIPCPK